MTAAYADSNTFQAYTGAAWVDISAYVVGDVVADWGILSNSPADRMASVGAMVLTLNNDAGLFTPGGGSMLTGWGRGVPVRWLVTFEGVQRVRFKGRVARISVPYDFQGLSTVSVNVVDWLDVAIKYPIFLQQVATDQTTADAARLVLAALDIQPDNTDIDEGAEILSSVFTTVGARTAAYTELSKLALSEFSYIYLRKDGTYGETLRIEDRHTRVSRDPSYSPVTKALSSKLLLSGGGGSRLKLQNGALLVLNQGQQLTFNNMRHMETETGENLINQITVRHNPVRVADAVETLFTLDSPIFIAAGATLSNILVRYSDPNNGGRRVSGTDMVTPAENTDYKMWTSHVDGVGAGVDLTDWLTVSVEYGAGGAVYSLTNTANVNGYVTVLQARGYGVYLDNPVDVILEDATSIADYGLHPYGLNTHYQSNFAVSETIAQTVLDQNKDAVAQSYAVDFIANISADLFWAFLTLDVGDLIQTAESVHGFTENYFIQSVKCTLRQGGIIYFSWGLVSAPFINDAYWELEVTGKGELESTTTVSY